MSTHLRSLKLRLLFPYALLIAVLTAVIGGITYLAGASTVTALADRTLEQMAARLQQTIEHQISGSSAVLEAAFPSGMPASTDLRDDWHHLRRHLWAATTLHPINNYVYYANVAGQSIGLRRLPNGTAELRVRRSGRTHRDFYALDSIDGKARYIGMEEEPFDPRKRPWFQVAAGTDSHAWTSVYIDFRRQDLVLTRARRVLNTQGAFEGVVATDVSLNALNRVVNEMARSMGGYAFVVEPDGDLVAASNMPTVQHLSDGNIQRITVHNSGNEMLARIYAQLRQHHIYEATGEGQVHQAHLRAPDGSPVHAAFVRVRDEAGLDWIAAVAIPRETILSDVSKLVGWVLIAGGLTFVLALGLGMRLFGRVADDIRALSEAVQRVGQGEFTAEFETRRKDEVGELARTFQRMRLALFTDRLTGIANRSALRQVLTRMTTPASPEVTPPPFALLFIDLNWFKPLNDQWGHDNGDRALIEIARRLQNHIRKGDHVARLGGDEFVVVLCHVDSLDVAQTISCHLEQLISEPLTTLQGIPDGETVQVGASIGIALYPQDATDVQKLLKLADQHMYESKHACHAVPSSSAPSAGETLR